MITMTEIAISKVKALSEQEENKGKALRFFVEGGGCSGFQYSLKFDDVQETDTKLEFDGVSIVIDAESVDYLKGTAIDWTESLQGEGFKISNPNAKSSCGCGSSFEV